MVCQFSVSEQVRRGESFLDIRQKCLKTKITNPEDKKKIETLIKQFNE
jgi:hypothetical protein